MGKQPTNPGEPDNNKLVCLVLFKMFNKNKISDLRMQIYNMQVGAVVT